MLRLSAAALLAFALLSSVPAHASCGSAFCSVNTDWAAQGLWSEPGTHVGLRFEYVDQSQPRAGTRKVAVGEIPMHHDEVRTINRNWLATVDHGLNDRWSLSFAMPLIDRSHEHIHNHHGAQLGESWNFTELGDARVLARYRATPISPGLTFGLKLPTGAYDVANDDGDVAERSLQPGTGTTDLIVGVFADGSWPEHKLSWFTQAAVQAALDTRDGYQRGARLGVDGGLRYDVGSGVGLQLQLNFVARDRDSGPEAEPEDSGGQYLWLSPGVTVVIGPNWQAYAFAQWALYQYVNGVQLTANWGAALGVSTSF